MCVNIFWACDIYVCVRAIFVNSEFPFSAMRRMKKMARIPYRNRNAFSYRTSLPRSISAEIYRSPEPISLRFTGIPKSRSASRNSIGKWGNSMLRYEPTDCTSGKRPKNNNAEGNFYFRPDARHHRLQLRWIYIFVGFASNRASLLSFFLSFLLFLFFRGPREFACIEA